VSAGCDIYVHLHWNHRKYFEVRDSFAKGSTERTQNLTPSRWPKETPVDNWIEDTRTQCNLSALSRGCKRLLRPSMPYTTSENHHSQVQNEKYRGDGWVERIYPSSLLHQLSPRTEFTHIRC